MPEPERLIRAYEAKIDDVRPGERSVVAIINTAALDRYKTVIDPSGMQAEAYRKNPVVLWEHGRDPVRGRLPVARNMWIKGRKQERDVIAKCQFRAGDEFAELLFSMYQDETLKGFSIDGLPDPASCSPPTSDELRKRPDLAECRCVYRSWELLEYSCVSVPGNAGALALAVSRGLWVPDDVRAALPPPLPPLRGRTRQQVEESVLRQARAMASGMLKQALKDARDHARGDI